MLMLALFMPACHQTMIVPLQAPRNGLNRADLRMTARSYAFGIIEGRSGRAECRDGIESVKISKGVMDSVIHLLIGQIYTTESVDVHCVRPHLKAAEILAYKSHTLQGVYFDSNSSVIQGDSHLILDELTAFLKENPELRIRLTGHTDLIGSAAANERLSLERADAAKRYLMNGGIAANRIVTEGRGARNPAVSAFDEDSSAINRRIEIAPVKPAAGSVVTPAKPEVVPPPVGPAPQTPAKPGSPAETTDATITMANGTVFKGTIIDQSIDRVVVNVDGRPMTLMKNQVRKIQYGTR